MVGEKLTRGAYACQRGEFTHGVRAPLATISFAVEARVIVGPGTGQSLEVLVNRPPIVSAPRVYREKAELEIYGSGLAHGLPRVPVPPSAPFAL